MSRNKSRTQNAVTTHSFLPLKPLERHSLQCLGSRPMLSSLWLFPVYLYSRKPIFFFFFFFKSFPFSFHFPRLIHPLGYICYPRLEPQMPQLNKWHVPKIKSPFKILARFFKKRQQHFIHLLAGMRRTGSFTKENYLPWRLMWGCVWRVEIA